MTAYDDANNLQHEHELIWITRVIYVMTFICTRDIYVYMQKKKMICYMNRNQYGWSVWSLWWHVYIYEKTKKWGAWTGISIDDVCKIYADIYVCMQKMIVAWTGINIHGVRDIGDDIYVYMHQCWIKCSIAYDDWWIHSQLVKFERFVYSKLHWECHSIGISNFNLIILFTTIRGQRDLENEINDRDLRLKKWHCKCNRLYHMPQE